MTRKPDPLPDANAVFILPDGRPSPDFFRWLRDADRAVKATIDVIDAPPAPDPQYELVEDWPIYFPYVEDGDYVLIQKSAVARTVNITVSDCDSGTCTATFKINSTPLGGSANSVSSTEQSQSHSSANILAAGDDLVVTISSNASCEKVRLNAQTTRTLTT